MKRKLFVAAILLLAVSAAAAVSSIVIKRMSNTALHNVPGARIVELKGETLRTFVADTPEARAKGLGGRPSLAEDEGMLFVFDKEGRHQFWMKDMRFPIDIVWISDDGRVVDLRENVSPNTYPEILVPAAPARYVLELSAGFVEEHGVVLGDTVWL